MPGKVTSIGSIIHSTHILYICMYVMYVHVLTYVRFAQVATVNQSCGNRRLPAAVVSVWKLKRYIMRNLLRCDAALKEHYASLLLRRFGFCGYGERRKVLGILFSRISMFTNVDVVIVVFIKGYSERVRPIISYVVLYWKLKNV